MPWAAPLGSTNPLLDKGLMAIRTHSVTQACVTTALPKTPQTVIP
jgi:hypothetical protein